jgi:hypothetical protein
MHARYSLRGPAVCLVAQLKDRREDMFNLAFDSCAQPNLIIMVDGIQHTHSGVKNSTGLKFHAAFVHDMVKYGMSHD